MNRFLLTNIISVDGLAKVDDLEQVHHIRDVLRLKPGKKVMLFDGKGNEYQGVVDSIGESFVQFKISKHLRALSESVKLTVACAIPKNVKMDDIVDKLTQLNVARIIPLNSQRVVVKFDKQRIFSRLERWEKIALSATKQSQRSLIPVVDTLIQVEDLFRNSKEFDLKLIPTLYGETQSLKSVLNKSDSHERRDSHFYFKNILVAIGPEGDFSEEEVEMAKGHGFIPVSLGKNVLRVDTAAIAVASFILLNENH